MAKRDYDNDEYDEEDDFDQEEVDTDDDELEEEEEEEEEGSDLDDKPQDDDIEELQKELEGINHMEQDLLKNLRRHKDDDILKGQAVKNQKALWDKTLELRILLQKPFSNSNRLPMDPFRDSICKSDESVNEAYSDLIKSSKKTLESILEFQEALLQQNQSISQATDGKLEQPLKGTDAASSDIEYDEEWLRISQMHSRMASFRNKSIDKWQRKTQVTTGAAAMKGKLQAFNQSISDQVASYVRDPTRMLKGMRLYRSNVAVFGTTVQETVGTEQDKNEDGDPELLDDSEFFQQLLKEFFDNIEDPASSEAAWYALKRNQNKKRKIVDRRASKSRKISGVKFSTEEERIVIELQSQIGNKWARIATHLPGRTDNDVKNFWSSRQKRLTRLLHNTNLPSSSQTTFHEGEASVNHPATTNPEGQEILNSSSVNYIFDNPEMMMMMNMLPMPMPLPMSLPLPDLSTPTNLFNSQQVVLEMPLPLQMIPDPCFCLESLEDVIGRCHGTVGNGGGLVDDDMSSLPLDPACFRSGDGIDRCQGNMSSNGERGRGNEMNECPEITGEDIFDDFPPDMFDHIETLPSPSNW